MGIPKSAGYLIIVAGAVMAVVIHVFCAFADPEYAKHDDSFYAFMVWIGNYGWIALTLFGIGFLTLMEGDE